MRNKNINPYFTPPEGYAILPTFENGAVDLSKVIFKDTSFGKVAYVPIEKHPYLKFAIRATINAGYMNEDGTFNKKVPRTAWGIWVKVYTEAVQMEKCDWTCFESKWNYKNLQQSTIKNTNQRYNLWYERFKMILRNAGFEI